MFQENKKNWDHRPQPKLEWIEPEVQQLSVAGGTLYNVGSGGDGCVYPDCTRS